MTDPFLLGLASLVCAFGAFVQGAAGFGMNLIAAPLLLLIAPELVPVALIVASMSLAATMAWRCRNDADLAGMGWGLAARVPASFVAASLLAAMSPAAINLFVAVAVLLAVLASLTTLKVRPSPSSLLVAGAATGLMGTTTSIGGPPMALLYQHESGPTIRGTLALYFLFGCCTSLVAYRWNGLLDLQTLASGLALIPGTLLGYAASGPMASRLDRGAMRPAILALCGSMALALIVGELLG